MLSIAPWLAALLSSCALLPLAPAGAPTSTAPAAASAAATPQAEFERLFTGRALRVDYFHSGDADEEHLSLDALRLEGEWPGSRTRLLDDTNLGLYQFAVVDSASNREVYTRGFASIFGEWQTTGEAKSIWRTFHESQRLPEPRAAVQLVLRKRLDDGGFHEIWSQRVDPTGRFVDRSALSPRGSVGEWLVSGPPAAKVDLLVLAEGYTEAQRAKFTADANRLLEVMFATEPYRARRSDFNVRTLFVAASESGISNPRKGEWRDAPFGCTFNSFDSDRYVLTTQNRALREAAAQAPYDALILLCNARKYGGGGIFNLYATVTADTEPAPYVFVHEFGHSFAGLADEYYTSQVAYEAFVKPGVEPWEPNVTALLDPANLKWRDLLAPGLALPTPWRQAEYDKDDLAYQKTRAEMIERKAGEDEVEALFREVKRTSSAFLQAEPNYGKVGAFEGAAYQAKGLYRPEVDCIMFTRNPTHFCKVCERAVNRAIDLYAR